MLDSPFALQVGQVVLSGQDAPQTQREKLARIVLDSLYQFVGLLDAQGHTLEINRAALDGAGLDMDLIHGKPFWEARWFQVSRETVAQQRDFVQRARQGEFIRCDMAVYGRSAGEETIVVDFSLAPVRDARGEVVFLLAEGRDITEKKRTEAELARKTAELQTLLDRVRQLDQLKSDLFANVSHELRTPLTLILGPADALLAQPEGLSEVQRGHIALMRRNAMVLLKQVNDLLDVAKIDARKMALQRVPCELSALVQGVAEQFHALAPQRDLRYVVYPSKTVIAEVDPERIERVLLNLLSNAFKFTPAGGRVSVSLRTLPEDQVVLSVQDSGPGIPLALRQAVFERFQQLQAGTTRQHGGTGLGLAIAKELVALHGGSISVTEAPGGGALFQVALPLCSDGAMPVRPPLGPRGPAEQVEGVLGELMAPRAGPPAPLPTGPFFRDARDRPTVLVVEDNADMRAFIVQSLAADHRVVDVGDGATALVRARQLLPDLVLTDLMLPQMGGDQLIAQLRQHEPLRDVPVLVLSARQDEELRTRLLADGAQDYLSKPFSAHELRARVRNLTVMKRARDALRQELRSQTDDLAQLTEELIGSRRALQKSERRWFSLFQHAPVGVLLMAESGQILSANPAFCALLQYSEEALCALTLECITPAEDRAEARQRIAQLLQGAVAPDHLQRRFQRRDTALVWTHTSVSQVYDEQEGERFLILVAADVTERRRAEEALHQARNDLARVSRVSTLGELAASIAHEVNQPLGAIVANGHATLRWMDAQPPNPQEAQAAVQRIIRDANHASQVIARIRRFLQPGERPPEAVQLTDVIAEVLGLVRKEAVRAGVALRFQPTGEVPPVPADRVQLQQVVLNLVMNALEAVAEQAHGPRWITVGLVREVREALRIEVCDSGPGIAPEIQDRLFDAFQTTKAGGMGMGLAISRSIVESHGGRLWVSPGDGPGTMFSVLLPLEAV
ncbi:MAG: ATP-binding protein [Burkholderiaceae bacterium]|nr:ATP-binding protein [Burkholderiaceae bacterium]